MAAGGGCVAGSCCILSSVVLFVIASWVTQLFVRFTPVYTDMVCSMGAAQLKHMKFGVIGVSPTEFTVEIETVCRNPNFYTIGFAMSEKGQVSMTTSRTPVGYAMESPYSASSLPAYGNGSIWTTAQVSVSGDMLLSLLPSLTLSKGVPLYLEMNNKLKVDISFFFGSVNLNKWVRKKCGMEIASLVDRVGNKDSVGPIACADNWNDLVVPRLGDTGSSDIVISAENMGDDIKKGALVKNVAFGISMLLLYSGGVALLFMGLRRLLQWSKRRTADSRKMSKAQMYNDPDSGNSSGSEI